MFIANNGVIVMNLLLYIRKGEGKGCKQSPFDALI